MQHLACPDCGHLAVSARTKLRLTMYGIAPCAGCQKPVDTRSTSFSLFCCLLLDPHFLFVYLVATFFLGWWSLVLYVCLWLLGASVAARTSRLHVVSRDRFNFWRDVAHLVLAQRDRVG